MRILSTIPALLASAALLSACSKPAEQTADNVADSADGAAAAASGAASDAAATSTAAVGAMAPGGAVSPPPEVQNDAVNTDTNKTETTQSPGSNSFTEGQAKGHIENAGYTDVSGLIKTPEGMWTAAAKKDGKSVKVSVDFKGAVTAK